MPLGPSGPDLSLAVRASCAIPGYFRPVELGRRTYVDGGVRSPTNADVLARAPVDVAIVISPMSGRALGRFGLPHLVRRYASAKVAEEARRLERRGIATVVLEPGPEAVAALGTDPMCDDHLGAIVTAGFLDAGDQLRSAAADRVLDGLRRPRPGARPAA